MNIAENLNKIFNKQFLLTMMISEFIVVADYAFFYLYNQNAIGPFDQFIMGLLVIFFSVICLLIFIKLIINKIFLFSPVGFFLITLYVPLMELFNDLSNIFAPVKLLSLGTIFLIWVLLYFLFRHEDSVKIIKNSFFLSLIFFSTSLLDFITLKLNNSDITYEKSFELLSRNESPVKISFDSELELPNIIYIVPDRYGGIDQLKNYFNYNNSIFHNALEDRGFIIGKDSRSNYPSSYASILSTLNSSYIIKSNNIKKTQEWAFPAITNSFAYSNLNDLGYELHNVNNWWEGTRFILNEESNFYSEYIGPNSSVLSYYLNEKTPFASILRKLSKVMLKKTSNFLIDARLRCDIQKNQFQKISDLAQSKNNGLFIYAHLMVPHPPYLLNASGDCNPTSMTIPSSDQEANKTKYIESLRFFNDEILNIFDAMLQTNNSFIFVIQSDEGPNPCWYVDPCDDYWDLKTGSINAFYASNKLQISKDDLKTPINNFIYIYNYLLDNDDAQTLEHVIYKRKSMKENLPFEFEEIKDFEIIN